MHQITIDLCNVALPRTLSIVGALVHRVSPFYAYLLILPYTLLLNLEVTLLL